MPRSPPAPAGSPRTTCAAAPPTLTARRHRPFVRALPGLLAVAAVAPVVAVLLPGHVIRPGPQRPAAPSPTPCPTATAAPGAGSAAPPATPCPDPVTVHVPWYGRLWPWN
ncbi:hypothetical protein [Catenuloplanes indicus]|uniref:Uncharacterized protein n=1 Tax=Catenuloplanes indicus TaxID=137267 RepID=A0AAE3VVD5_9ACTN|nr:hypothetical protein [Catenuloplanes indicus]MDQ0364355.1 hypothetical protein [Catenuloplanes indicus]